MNLDEVVEKVCRLPIDFYGGSKSMVELVWESGVEACPAALTAANILAYLRNNPTLVDQWLNWSANKRVTSGWYFARRRGDLVVGFHPQGETLAFKDPVLACAEFVTREVAAIVKVPRKKR